MWGATPESLLRHDKEGEKHDMIAYLFPGQGSQKEGMYNLFGDCAEEVSEVFDEAAKVTGRDIKALCRDATEEELKQTLNTQISVTTMNMAYSKLLEKRGIKPDVVAGHSLGQLSAIAAAGVISTVDLFRLVNKRAELMSGINESGKLATAVGLDKETVTNICEEVSKENGKVSIALENSPTQYVIGGKEEDVDKAVVKLKEAGALKVVEIKVSNAFHTYMMAPMVEDFKKFVNSLEFKKPVCKTLLNCKGGYSDDPEEIREDVINQCVNTVKWVDCINRLLSDENVQIAEVGAGKIMASLVKGFDRKKKVYLMSNPADFEEFVNGA